MRIAGRLRGFGRRRRDRRFSSTGADGFCGFLRRRLFRRFLWRGEEFFAQALRQFREDDGVCVAELGLPLGGSKGGPVFGGDPVGAGEVRCGLQALDFDELGEALGTGGEGDDTVRAGREVHEGEHLATDGFVADPEDEVVAPLEGFGDVREREQEGAGSLGVHAEEYRRGLLTPRCQEVWHLYFGEACPLRARPFLCTSFRL
jgi:hypothetical protein